MSTIDRVTARRRRTSVRRGQRIVCGALLGAAAAGLAVAAVAPSAHATRSGTGPPTSDVNAPSAASDTTTTVSVRGPDLPGWYSAYVPRVQCPASHPWLLNQQFNSGSGFRISPGVLLASGRDWSGDAVPPVVTTGVVERRADELVHG